jgi:hypothetical protein
VLKQTNPNILAVLKSDSEVLERVQNGFHTMIRSRGQDGLPPIEITCFFEELPLPGVGIVCNAVFVQPSKILSIIPGCSFSLCHPAWLYSDRHSE